LITSTIACCHKNRSQLSLAVPARRAEPWTERVRGLQLSWTVGHIVASEWRPACRSATGPDGTRSGIGALRSERGPWRQLPPAFGPAGGSVEVVLRADSEQHAASSPRRSSSPNPPNPPKRRWPRPSTRRLHGPSAPTARIRPSRASDVPVSVCVPGLAIRLVAQQRGTVPPGGVTHCLRPVFIR
jgi:hypothetical protein